MGGGTIWEVVGGEIPSDEQLHGSCSIFNRAKVLACKDFGGDCMQIMDGRTQGMGVLQLPNTIPSQDGQTTSWWASEYAPILY